MVASINFWIENIQLESIEHAYLWISRASDLRAMPKLPSWSDWMVYIAVRWQRCLCIQNLTNACGHLISCLTCWSWYSQYTKSHQKGIWGKARRQESRQGIHSGFETWDRCHQKSKTGVSVVPQWSHNFIKRSFVWLTTQTSPEPLIPIDYQFCIERSAYIWALQSITILWFCLVS